MVLLTVVTTSNPHTLYFDHPIEKPSYIRLLSVSLCNSWHNLKENASMVYLGSISSRFVRPRSFAHTTAGSLVCPIVFSTNQRLACTNRAGKSLIGQFSLVNNKDGGYL